MFSPSMVQEYFMTLMPLLMIYMPMSPFVPTAHGTLLSRLTYQNLQARNISTFLNSIPTQCQVQCDIVTGAAHNCQFLGCVCTREHALDLEDCVNCVVALTPYADGIVAEYQAILDEWTNDYCGDFSSPPLVVTLPGQSSSSDISTPSSTSDSASATASASATSTSPSSSTTSTIQVPSSAQKTVRSAHETTLYGVMLGVMFSFISMVL